MADGKETAGGVRTLAKPDRLLGERSIEPGRGDRARPLPTFTIDDLAQRPRLEWQVDEVLPLGGLILIYGKPKCRKTFLALDLSLSVARGSNWHGRKVRQGVVLYIAAEGGHGLFPRIQAWRSRYDDGKLRPDAFRVVDRVVPFLHAGAVDELAELIAEIRPTLIVIDTLARSIAGGEENSSVDMGQFVAACDRLRRISGSTVVIVHHVGRSGDNPRGSNALDGAVDTMVRVSSRGEVVTVHCAGQRDSAEFEDLVFRSVSVEVAHPGTGQRTTSCVLVPTHEPAARSTPTGLKPFQDAVVQALATARGEGELTMTALAPLAGVVSSQLHRVVDELHDLGIVNAPHGIRPRVAKLTKKGLALVPHPIPPNPGVRSGIDDTPIAHPVIPVPLKGPETGTKVPRPRRRRRTKGDAEAKRV